jgi:hypothetical protein
MAKKKAVAELTLSSPLDRARGKLGFGIPSTPLRVHDRMIRQGKRDGRNVENGE